MMELEGDLLEAARKALDEHDAACDQHAYLALLNPGNYELLGWDEVLGLPVLPDERVGPMKVWVVCCSQDASCKPRWAGSWHGERVWWVREEPHREEQDSDVDARGT